MANDSGNAKTASSSAAAAAAADSHIGSFITITTKLELRYEGVICFLDPVSAVIGLKNVRSYGTEGRKKDGPQVPPSDKISDYIMLRGSEIKDLKVKNRPPAWVEEPIHNDPAIIQSRCMGDLSSSSKPVSLGGGSMPEFCSYNEPSKLNMTTYPTVPSSQQSGNHFGEYGLSHQPTPISNTLGSNIAPTQLHGNTAAASSSYCAPLYLISSTTAENPAVCKAGPDPIPLFPVQSQLYPMFSSVNNIVSPSLKQLLSLPKPDQHQLSQARLSVLPPIESLYPDQKNIQVMSSDSLNSLHPATSVVQTPLLSLPSVNKLQSSEFTEEFDFAAMNEKFNKDEVWGYLGKAKQGDKIEVHKDKALLSKSTEDVLILDGDFKPAYSKDDFFDDISHNSSTRGGRNEPNRFNDRMKLDTETFGSFEQRKYPGYGGYGAGRGQNHGSFGRGRGDRGRGRGFYM